jgi:hypothetical protein
MSLPLFSPVEAFEAAHAFTWFSAAEDTASLAVLARADSTLWRWQAALAYVRNWPPNLLHPSDSRSLPVGRPRNLTLSEGREVFIAFIDAYNRLSVTDTVLFTSYIDGDPAAWPDWLGCLPNSR